MNKEKKHIIKSVAKDSIAEEIGLEPGDEILAVNNEPIRDILDYMFLVQNEDIVLKILSHQ